MKESPNYTSVAPRGVSEISTEKLISTTLIDDVRAYCGQTDDLTPDSRETTFAIKLTIAACFQNDKLRSDVEILRVKFHQGNEEIASLRLGLEESRGNADRLHRESELVVHNVNTWVKEQKYVNTWSLHRTQKINELGL